MPHKLVSSVESFAATSASPGASWLGGFHRVGARMRESYVIHWRRSTSTAAPEKEADSRPRLYYRGQVDQKKRGDG